MVRTLIIDPPGAFATAEELEDFIDRASQKGDADRDPLASAIQKAKDQLEELRENPT